MKICPPTWVCTTTGRSQRSVVKIKKVSFYYCIFTLSGFHSVILVTGSFQYLRALNDSWVSCNSSNQNCKKSAHILFACCNLILDTEVFFPAGRLLSAWALPPVSEPGHSAEEPGSQHSSQHPCKGTQISTNSVWHKSVVPVASLLPFFTRQARAGEYLSVLKGSVMSTLLDAGLLFLLRFALDDSVEGVMSAAVHVLKALLVCAEDEVSIALCAFFIYKLI